MSQPFKRVLEPSFQTSAMADIAFLLIIFFMITRVITSNKGIEHQLLAGAQDSANTLTIVLDTEDVCQVGAVHLQMREPGRIREAIQTWRDTQTSNHAVLITADHLPYGMTIAILDILHQEGFEVFFPIGSQRSLFSP